MGACIDGADWIEQLMNVVVPLVDIPYLNKNTCQYLSSLFLVLRFVYVSTDVDGRLDSIGQFFQ